MVLKVVNAAKTCIVWTSFPDDEATSANERTVAEKGMRTFLDNAKAIPFPHEKARKSGSIS